LTIESRVDTDGFLEDAAHFPGGHAIGVVFPRTPDEVAEVLRNADAVLPIGAQSSLTGGATPMGELVLSTSKMRRVIDTTATHVTVEPGVTIAELQDHLAACGAWFPPAPTFTGACTGGIVATNAAGPATFKYGSTRDWVDGLVVVLADGTVLDLKRGRSRARGRQLEIPTVHGSVLVPIPSYAMPRVAKRSAGYYAAEGMDPIDLFIGSEGSLGVITQVTFRILSPAPQTALALIPCTSHATWQVNDDAGIDVAAIEHMDRRSLEILREDGVDAKNHVAFPSGTALALLVQLELAVGMTAEAAYADIENALGDAVSDTSLGRFCRLLDGTGLLDATELAMPGDRRRAEQLVAIREGVPAGVNQRVGDAKRDIDPRIEKTAADMVVPFDRVGEMSEVYRRGFASRGLDFAIWGHLSDGNVHPNVIPRSFEDVRKGKEPILGFGREVARLGGCPLAEHGVGRSPVKQALLRQLYGDRGIEEMRAVKRALDPGSKLAPGVIFTTP
jgi:D-lactate dehydrogenase (cytochrome)